MTIKSLITNSRNAIPIIPVLKNDFANWIKKEEPSTQSWLKLQNFEAQAFTFSCLPDSEGKLKKIIVGLGETPNLYALSHLPYALPEKDYQIIDDYKVLESIPLELGWGLGAYQFSYYKKPKRGVARLVCRPKIDFNAVSNLLKAIYLVRDLANLPAEDCMPEKLAEMGIEIAKKHKARHQVIVGENLIKKNYPMIHAVGRASSHAPRLIDISWGSTKHKKITLVGKGVCFDSGGLDLKSADGMLDMKKDMAGAAHVLALADLIMASKLPVCLRVLIPAVENAVAGNAYHPGDIIKTRKGLTVEIGNTDAEGRLILSDALTEASSDKPDLLIDFATLTGAARIALGTEVAAFFTEDKALSQTLMSLSENLHDPIWPLPLYQPYRSSLDTPFADLNNTGKSRYGGAITAALFLKEFITPQTRWVHFDIMASNVYNQPGRPQGGEAMGLRVCFEFIKGLTQTA